MYCNKCGNEIAADAKFCPKCGAQYHTKGSVAKTGKMGNKKRITIIAISCVCLIALISVLGYLGIVYYGRYSAFKSGRGVSIGEGKYEYNPDDGEAILCDGYWHSDMVEIPSQIRLGLRTYRVTKIYDGLFQHRSRLTSVTLPDSVTEIGEYAFGWCSSLTSITLPEELRKIGDEAFYMCESLTSIALPEGVTEIGEEAFYGCSTEIGEYAFWGCDSLTSISLPNSEVEIGEEAIPSHCTIYYRN